MTYPTRTAPAGPGGKVARVATDGPADRAGLRVGDIVTHAEGEPLTDIIGWMWAADGASVALRVRTSAGMEYETILDRAFGEDWGVEFDGVVFDGVRECDNACTFCFVSQLPPGLRPTLHVRDDDYRLSFLAGNFVTLTNLDDADVERILTQRLSPLHVSLQAVDADVRTSLMCPTVEDRALEHIDTLLAGGIQLHVQIVLVPGVNDGEVLERSLEWLAQRSGIVSVGVVPVGITRYQRRITETYATPDSAASVLARLAPWSERMRLELGVGWVYAADEFYLAADETLPDWDAYDGFPQYENGIGMTRAFLDEAAAAIAEVELRALCGPRVTLVTGELFAPVLESLRERLRSTGCDVRVLPVANDLLGGNVSVAGLLAGADLSRAVAADVARFPEAAGVYLLPDLVMNDDGLTLDDMDLAGIAHDAGADVRLVSCDAAGLVSALVALSGVCSG